MYACMHVRPREPTRSTTAAAAARHNRIVVTGFGPFRGVSDNPSQRLVEALQEQEQQQKEEQGGPSPVVVCCRVIEVRRSVGRSTLPTDVDRHVSIEFTDVHPSPPRCRRWARRRRWKPCTARSRPMTGAVRALTTMVDWNERALPWLVDVVCLI